MKKSDVKIGMKVAPFQKTVPGYNRELEHSIEWKRRREAHRNFMYVVEWEKEIKCWVLRHKIRGAYGGDFFNSKDFQPYIPKKK